jgi:hypothetical protein
MQSYISFSLAFANTFPKSFYEESCHLPTMIILLLFDLDIDTTNVLCNFVDTFKMNDGNT